MFGWIGSRMVFEHIDDHCHLHIAQMLLSSSSLRSHIHLVVKVIIAFEMNSCVNKVYFRYIKSTQKSKPIENCFRKSLFPRFFFLFLSLPLYLILWVYASKTASELIFHFFFLVVCALLFICFVCPCVMISLCICSGNTWTFFPTKIHLFLIGHARLWCSLELEYKMNNSAIFILSRRYIFWQNVFYPFLALIEKSMGGRFSFIPLADLFLFLTKSHETISIVQLKYTDS